MKRRDFLAKTSLLAATAAVAPQLAFSAEAAKGSLAETAADCTAKGELCLQHCVESLSSGSKTMAACAVSVREMMVYCEALSKASARKSKHLKALAKIAHEACKDCEAQCRKHEKMDVCKTCADACATCAKECLNA
jgi:Cys-rich four helix bundle protein (predicted Tat secretion target)